MLDAVVLLAVFLAGGALGVFALLLAGIRAEERHMTLHDAPRTRTRSATRRFLGVYVEGPPPGSRSEEKRARSPGRPDGTG
ncbi:hypothetical protein [Thermomonospora catenispora]|uniref:hypothetical protein n=1 Tax=Thermomonospora catenispora TaxID=2493090 RepID=UPI001375B343|nr:hypothetical protein [Thermomonospora catenispora]TNY35658.1 hypothetical protein EIO00_17075 [Thermomonospora catenispora]